MYADIVLILQLAVDNIQASPHEKKFALWASKDGTNPQCASALFLLFRINKNQLLQTQNWVS